MDPVMRTAAATPTTATPNIKATAPTAVATKTTTGSTSLFDKDAFLKLLVAQVRYQDPSKPLDSSQFISQSAQFTTVEELQKLESAITQSSAAQRLLLSSSLIGKQVVGVAADGTAVNGTVTSVKISGSTSTVVVGRQELPVESVSLIS